MKNIDDELNEMYNEYFKVKKKERTSPLLEKMQEINIQKFINESYLPRNDIKQNKCFAFCNFMRKEIIDDMWDDWFDIRKVIKGMHFQVSNKRGTQTVIYRVVPRIDYTSKSWYVDLEKIVSSVEVNESGNNIQTFFVDNPAIDGEDFVLLHFYTLTGDVYANRGILKDRRLFLSETPLFIHTPKKEISKTQNSSMYLLNDTENKHETWYEANPDADIYIFDLESGKPILREKYWDEKEKCYKYKIRIDSGKRYFSFQIRYKGEGSNCYKKELTDLEIGKYYRIGKKGFPRDEYEAMKYFEHIDSPEADYEIAEIFLKGQNYRDDKLGMEYIKKSADNGFPPACVELAILYSISDFNSNKEVIKKYIDDAIQNDFAPALFAKAYAYETGFGEEVDINQSFRLYYRAAQTGFYPALCRFATQGKETTDDPDVMYVQFMESANNQPEYASFCLGMMLLHNNYISWKDTESHHIEPFEKEGFQIMLKAAMQGCNEAMYQVALSYLFGLGVSKNRENALEWYNRIENDDRIYYARAMCLQEKSIGDFNSDEIDILERAVEYDMDGMICNELGLYNRLIEEYEKAIDYFQMAIDKGWSLACYYLAELYSEDYEAVSLEQIIQLYEKGASMGCKECEKKLQLYYQRNSVESEESFRQTLKGIAQDMNDRIDSINSKIDEVNERTKDVQEELRNLSVFVKEDLTMFIREQKRQLSQQIRNDSEKKELMVSQLCTDVSRYINARMVCSNEVDIIKETEYLISIFGRSWDRLEKESRTSLISASVLWKLCADIKGDFDYSGICISATSALESELKKYFFVGFQKYLENTYGVPSEYKWEETFNNWPEILLSTSKKRYKREWNNYKYQSGDRPHIRKEKDTYFTLGKMPFIFGVRKDEDVSEEQRELLINRLNEYLSTFIIIPSDKTAIDVFIGGEEENSFIDKCERIRIEYRNKAAHDDILSEEQAKGCYHEVIGKIESYKYTSDVTGLLLQLFQHIK